MYEHFFYSNKQREEMGYVESTIDIAYRDKICKIDGKLIEFTRCVTSNLKDGPVLPDDYDDVVYLGVGEFSHLVK
jgi:hypothetical protein